MLRPNAKGFFPFTPATNLIYGLREALRMIREEGLENVFQRHRRHAHATRVAVQAWGLDNVCELPSEYSSSLTAVFMPDGHDADRLRQIILESFDMSLGAGLSKLSRRGCSESGIWGASTTLMLAGTLSGVEMGLSLAGVPHKAGGVGAALHALVQKNFRE